MLHSLQEVVRPPQENVRSETIAQALAEVTEPDAVIFTDNEFYTACSLHTSRSLSSAPMPGAGPSALPHGTGWRMALAGER